MASSASIEEQARDASIRYDRQVRLWGPRAQNFLQKSLICVVNATSVGTEALKNLVLPGIRGFTIIDGAKVSENDVSNNFFVHRSSIGESRAKVASELIQEMNDLVQGNFLEEDPIAIINDEERIKWFLQFNGVIAHNLREKELRTLARFLFQNDIPLFHVNTNGLITTLRLQAPELRIMETKPDNSLADLRLNDPWPELVKFVAETHHQREGISTKQHKHIPFVSVLIHEWNLWKQQHDGNVPTVRERTTAFKQQVLAASRGGTNFVEALAESKLLWAVPKIPSNVAALLDDPKSTNLTPTTDTFWFFIRGLKEFAAKHDGYLPLPGSLPDMTSDTQNYLRLQQCFNDKAQRDREEFSTIVNDLLHGVGRDTLSNDSEEVELFCKNVREIQVIRTRLIEEELALTPENGARLNEYIQEPLPAVSWYLALRAADRFRSAHNRFPGEHNDQIESDVPLLKEFSNSLLNELGIPSDTVSDDHIQEICRYGGSEIHTISALIGGVVAQEVIKVLAGPVFVPLNNTFLYCGIDSEGIQIEA